MHAIRKHILCMISAFFMTCFLYGQNTGHDITDKDAQLNRYELECSLCMEMKDKVKAGINVSRKEAEDLIQRFLDTNRKIKEDIESLTSEQRYRFEAINEWFRTGRKPLALDHDLALEAVTQDHKAHATCGRHVGLTQPDKLTFRRKIRTTVMATASIPISSFGIMAGIQSGRLGGYLHLESNFTSGKSEYSCLSNGMMDNGSGFWSNGKAEQSIMSAKAGMLAGISRWLDLYIGAGYGQDRIIWEDLDGNKAEVTDISYKGISAEAGAIVTIKGISFGLGCWTTSFRRTYLDISLGIRF